MAKSFKIEEFFHYLVSTQPVLFYAWVEEFLDDKKWRRNYPKWKLKKKLEASGILKRLNKKGTK